MNTNTNTTNSGEGSTNLPPPGEENQPISSVPFVVLTYKHKSIPTLTLVYPENPVKIYSHSYYRPIKISLTVPDDWQSTVAYRRWLTKVKDTLK